MISNSTIKLVQSLKHKKYRQKYNLFVVEGWKSISTVLSQEKLIVDRLFAIEQVDIRNFRQQPDIIKATAADIKKISHLQTPSDAIALVRLKNEESSECVLGHRVIYLDDIQDPGNLGTIIRIADWYGFSTILRSPGSADFYGPKVVQSTMGSFVNLNLLTMDQKELLTQKNMQLVVTSLKGSDRLESLSATEPICLVIGNEGSGISQLLLDNAQLNYTIAGATGRKAESLNAAVATGIMCDKLYELTAAD